MKLRLLALLASVAWLIAAPLGEDNTLRALSTADEAVSAPMALSIKEPPRVGLVPGSEVVPAIQTTPAPSDGQRLARFDEATGAFSVRYPPDFRQIRRVHGISDSYSYTFGTDAGDGGLAVSFIAFGDTALTDGEWEMVVAVLGPETLLKGLGDIFEVKFTQSQREEGESGVHTLHWQGESASEELRCALRAEESGGVLALTAIVAPFNQWTERQEMFQESLSSLDWSPEVVREQIGSTAEAEDEGETTETVPDIVLEPSPETGESPEATETPESSETDLIEFSELTEEAATPEAVEAPGDLDVVQSSETPEGVATVTFEDPDGVFSLTYPAEFENAQGPSLDGGNYVYAVWIGDGSYYLAAVFNSLADEALSDEEWEQAIEPMIKAAADNFAEDATQKFRTVGDPGEHWLYIELDSKSADARAFYYMNEAKGVLAMVMGQVPRDEWPDWEDRLVDAVDAFVWWPDATRQMLASEQPIDPQSSEEAIDSVATEQPEPKPTPTGTATAAQAAGPDIPDGKGGLVMLNCRSDVLTVDVIPDGIFQELAPKTGEECHRGAPIFLDPGDHILKASIAGVDSKGEATVTIVAGQWFEFTWR